LDEDQTRDPPIVPAGARVMTDQEAGLPRAALLTIARGAGIVFIGTLVGSGLKYAFHIIVARTLGAGLFGFFVLGLTVFTMAEIIAQMGLPQGAVRYVSLFQSRQDQARLKGVILFSARSVVVSGTVVGLGLFLASSFLSVHVFGRPELVPAIRIFALMTPFSALGTILLSVFQGFKVLEYKVYVGEFIEPFLRIVGATIAFLAFGRRLPGVLWSYGLAAVLALLSASVLLKKLFPPLLRKEIRPVYEARRLMAFSWPLLFSSLLGQLLIVTDTFILGILGTSEDVGIYGAAQRTALLANMIFLSFNAIFAPIVADFYQRQDRRDLDRLFKIVSKWAFSLTLPASLLLILLAKPILGLFGGRFVQGAGALAVLAGGWLFHSALGNAGAVLTMSGRSRWHLVNFSLLLVLQVSFNFVLIPRYGILGAAVGTAGSLALIDVITCIQVYWILGLHPFQADELKPLLAGGAALILTKLLMDHVFTADRTFAHLPILSSICIITYGAALYALRISREEKLVLSKVWARLRRAG
jgi:O-antigen/teichoic acid export membrane protein